MSFWVPFWFTKVMHIGASKLGTSGLPEPCVVVLLLILLYVYYMPGYGALWCYGSEWHIAMGNEVRSQRYPLYQEAER